MGVRGEIMSVDAIRAATTNMTVVKKPKVFWSLTRVEYMVGGVWRVARSLFLESVWWSVGGYSGRWWELGYPFRKEQPGDSF